MLFKIMHQIIQQFCIFPNKSSFVCSFIPFLLVIVLSVVLRLQDYDWYIQTLLTVYSIFGANSKHCEKFEDAKAVIIRRNLKTDEQHNGQRKKDKTRISDLKTLHRIPNHILDKKRRYNRGN